MKEKEFYSIGEVSKMCNISKKALRFYDKIGIIVPDKVCDDNNYRFYSHSTLLSIPVIKYFKHMGFKLEDMKQLLESNDYEIPAIHFRKKIDELRELEISVRNSHTCVKDWYELIAEAELVIKNNVTQVSVKYLDNNNYCYMAQNFNYNYRESIINIDWTNYLESIKNEITGPVILNFSSFKDKMSGKSKKVRIMQKPILKYEDNQVTPVGGHLVATCYHIGNPNSIHLTYEKMCEWAQLNGYKCNEECYERYVTDYWTLRDENQFVVEVIVGITKM
ncbi:MAG: MerR family transcriptional regulator [Anaerotignaceae bacterium]